MFNNITGLEASPGSAYGSIKIEWDIPSDWYPGGYLISNVGELETEWDFLNNGFNSFNYGTNNNYSWRSNPSNLQNVNIQGLQNFNYESQKYSKFWLS